MFKIGASFLKDIAIGQKHFGFSYLCNSQLDTHLLAYGCFINYSIKQPVLIVVNDLDEIELDKFRENFTPGTMWKFSTLEWGKICFIDLKQIYHFSEEFNLLNLSQMTKDFDATFWALPNENLKGKMQKVSLSILSEIHSVTLVARYGETKASEIKKIASYYQCFDIPLKGLLTEEESI